MLGGVGVKGWGLWKSFRGWTDSCMKSRGRETGEYSGTETVESLKAA